MYKRHEFEFTGDIVQFFKISSGPRGFCQTIFHLLIGFGKGGWGGGGGEEREREREGGGGGREE